MLFRVLSACFLVTSVLAMQITPCYWENMYLLDMPHNFYEVFSVLYSLFVTALKLSLRLSDACVNVPVLGTNATGP